MEQIYTNKGWVDVESFDKAHEEISFGNHGCCDCDEPATVLTEAGKGLLWAQCVGCADETRASSIDDRRQRAMECEDGYDTDYSEDDDDSYDEWDGQPDEAQEWHDFDPDC